MRSLIFILLQLSFLVSSSAKICQGKLIDKSSKQAVEFANIGLVGKGIGTVSNEKGEFKFEVPDSLSTLPVRISVIGYKEKTVSLTELQAGAIILMEQDAVTLSEVTIRPKKNKIKILGNETLHSSVTAGFKKNSLGAEIGVRLNIKNPQTQLRNFKLNITRNTLEKAVFRLNIYKVDENGLPGDNILKENIIIEPKEKTGLIDFDLKPYSIYVEEDVFVAIEWIKDLGDVTGLMFSTKMVGSATYFRQASQDKWEKVSPIGVGIHVEVGY